MKRNLCASIIMLIVGLSVLRVASATAQIPQLPLPQIVRADTDISFTQLLIDGIHFGTALPKVTLAGTQLTRRETSSHRILGAYPTIPRSDDNKDAVIAPISLCPNRGKSADFVLISGQ